MTSQQPEPLKVFLQHRIKSIISKEWWDFVVNVNNMNSDHASLLYSVANLCPSFQNFLRTRDKELNYILKKRPQIKPRIFSGSERLDIPSVSVVPTEVPSSHRKSCSAELDQILNELYPDERSIIKRKPRTFGPISKQKRLQNLKKFQLLQAQKEIPTEESTTPSLSKILREDKPCTTVKRPESLPPSTSNRDSKHSVEYTISNYDVNRNKLSLNMKKVKKIIKVKKKIMTYTDNNDKSRTKYLLESETPDLKRELIKKYRIKKCSVALQRLTWKQIKEIKTKGKVTQSQLFSSANVIKTLDNNLVTNSETVPPISLKFSLGKTISIQRVNSPETSSDYQKKTNKEACMSPTPPPPPQNSNISEDSTSKNEEEKIGFTLKEVSNVPEIDLPPRETLSVLDKISKECDRLLSCSSEPESKQPDETVAQKNSAASDVIQQIERPCENSIVSATSKLDHLESISVKSEPILLKKIISQMNGIIGNPPVLNDNIILAALKGKNIMNDEGDTCSLPQTVISRINNTVIKKEPMKKIDNEQSKIASCEGKSESSSKLEVVLKTTIKEESSWSSIKKNNDCLVKLLESSNHSTISKLSHDNISIEQKSQEKDIENQKPSLSQKFPANQKDNAIEEFKSKEELKTVYCHGGIVPLGKSSTSLLERNSLDKKHILSLKEKKMKEIPDNDSLSKLKEMSIPCSVIESKPGSPLNGLSDSSCVTAVIKEKSVPIGAVIESKQGSPFTGLMISPDTAAEINEKCVQNSVIESEPGNKLGGSSDATAEGKEKSVHISVIESNPVSPLGEVRNEEGIKDNSKVDKPNNAVSAIKTEVTEAAGEKTGNNRQPVIENPTVDLDLSEENYNESAIIENSAVDIQDSGVGLQDSPNENTGSVQNSFEEDTELEEDPEKDDVILVETPLEVIELDSQDEDTEVPAPPIKMKVERVENDIITICSEGDEDSDIIAKHKENDSNQINTAEEEPLPKRPRLEINMTKMEYGNMNCKVCNASFTSRAEWLQHYENDVPKCAPNLKVSWESPEQALY